MQGGGRSPFLPIVAQNNAKQQDCGSLYEASKSQLHKVLLHKMGYNSVSPTKSVFEGQLWATLNY